MHVSHFPYFKIFCHLNGDEIAGEWRKLHNEELSELYSLPNIVRVVKFSRKIMWVQGRPYWILHPVSCHTSEAVTMVFKCS